MWCRDLRVWQWYLPHGGHPVEQGMRGDVSKPGLSSAVELLLAAGCFLQLESGWTTTELLALLAGREF